MTNKAIAEYKEKNKDFIAKNRHKLSQEAIELENIILVEEKEEAKRIRQIQAEEKIAKKMKVSAKKSEVPWLLYCSYTRTFITFVSPQVENKEKLIDDLMFSDADAKDIVNQHAQAKIEAELEENKPKFSTGMHVTRPQLIPT